MPGGLIGKPGGMPGGMRAPALGCIWMAAGPPEKETIDNMQWLAINVLDGSFMKTINKSYFGLGFCVSN